MGLLYKIMDVTRENIDEIDEWLDDCNIDEIDIVEFIRTQIKTLECCAWDADLRLLIFEYILTQADVSELIEYIKINKKTNDVTLATTPQVIDNALSNVIVEDRNDSWLFLVGYFGIGVLLEEQNN